MIKDEEFQRISVYMKQRYGIDLSQKKVIVNGRLENYIKRGGWHSFDEFMNAVEHDRTGNQEKMLVNFLTTNHTYFMREFEHFDFFRSEVLPWLKQKEAARKDLRIWCGAASSGGSGGVFRDGEIPVGYQSAGHGYLHQSIAEGTGRYLYRGTAEKCPATVEETFL